MKDNISPEEKLLRLIKGEKKETRPTTKTEKPSFLKADFSSLNLKKILLGLFILSCISLVIAFSYPWFVMQKIDLPKANPQMPGEETALLKEETKTYEYYLEPIKQRQIFATGTSSERTEQPIAVASADMVKDLSLLGVISGANPQAIIEDKKSQKTFYVSKGQLIGELQVEDIKEGKIILNHKGQRYELSL